MKDETDIKLQKMLTEMLQETHRKGLAQGSKAMCHVIMEKAQDQTKSYEERIREIERFCKVSLGGE